VESDRKIRALSLLHFSKFSLSEIDDAVQADVSSKATDSVNDTTAYCIAGAMKFNFQPSDSDAHIIYYVSGAIARSVSSATKCDSCREALVCSSRLPAIHV
jgi:hypothetical protein